MELTKLKEGKSIGAFPGFVKTFNYLVDFIQNLKGEGELDKSKKLVVDRTVEDHPVVRGGGGDEVNAETMTMHLVSGASSNVRFSKTATADGWRVAIDVYYV